ncbi:hypothetical protein HYX18_03150 [Candidatus Woesearchaeota archaeon]|nr:hypothetical protein [Candidatus Woesearchaeota archaeon]
MKKAQLEQPFVIIFGIIVIAFVLIYGGNVIYKSLTLSSNVEFNVFIDKLKKEVDNCYSLDFGSACSLNKLNVPSSLASICFINVGEDVDYTKIPDKLNKTIINSVDFGREENVFLASVDSKNDKSITIDKLKVSENPLCDKIVNRELNFILENKGNFVQLRK